MTAAYSTLPRFVVTSPRVAFAEVGEGFALLRDVVSGLRPDLILGVNRGGAAVGGMLAKSIGLLAYVLEVDFGDESRGRVVEHRVGPRPDPRTIVLVDDIVRSGSHMRLAAAHVREAYPRAELHRFALVAVARTEEGTVDWAPIAVTDPDARTPWEE